MSEKVLGFKEKDSDKFEERLNFPAEITIDENKLVPVVSVEWLEKYCKNNFIAEGYSFVWIQDLLKAVRLQAVEEKE